ncbi:VOC family protein [Tessaracoccus antarcticus]|uniref:VOC family protein n=1 Tax=Tessaracoccus antarcticus TaxID=2479848 RepID=A0A3M0G2V0_9ACTN|nr:VOC family protein [Tessaracoccus antarcticus]RMB58878.1 VOC family protein [Tessaracoccus antarcticus]
MTGLTPYLAFDGTARDALTYYRDVFGGALVLNTYEDFGRTDGPAEAISHGMLQGPVELFASDVAAGESALKLDGILFSLLGTAEPAVMETWFARLAEDGSDIDALQQRSWGDHDGQVTDRFQIRWLIGYQG